MERNQAITERLSNLCNEINTAVGIDDEIAFLFAIRRWAGTFLRKISSRCVFQRSKVPSFRFAFHPETFIQYGFPHARFVIMLRHYTTSANFHPYALSNRVQTLFRYRAVHFE